MVASELIALIDLYAAANRAECNVQEQGTNVELLEAVREKEEARVAVVTAITTLQSYVKVIEERDSALAALLVAKKEIENLNQLLNAAYVNPAAKSGLSGVQTASTTVKLDPAGVSKIDMTFLENVAVQLLNRIKAGVDDETFVLPVEVQMDIDTFLMTVTLRRNGVA